MSARVVILGASGFIGHALVRVLGSDGAFEVIPHSSRTLDLTRPESVDAVDALAGPDMSLVFASALTPDRGQNVETLSANLAIATNVARALERRPFAHVTYVGSDAVYGFDVNPVTEATPVAPSGAYGLAKYAGEKILECVTGPKSIPLLILRVAGVYGPGDPHGSYGPNSFARSITKDRTMRMFGDGEEERDHIFVGDVARLVAALVRARVTGILNLATGEARSFATVAKAMRDLLPYEVVVNSVPRKGAITHRRYDTSRLRQALPGFAFTPFADGLRTTLQAFGAL
jgi:UDP-glucose 4-epimerase